jgi:spore maturation protein A
MQKIKIFILGRSYKLMNADRGVGMLNYIWFGFLVFGFITGIINGRIEIVTHTGLEYAGKAIELSLGLLGVMCLWSGLMRIAEKCGLIKMLARISTPVLKILFPEIPDGHPAMASIVMNVAANFFGLGNAATPLGIRAMNEMQRLNRNPGKASDAMCMFAVLNTAAVQFIPTTIIAIRAAAGSANPSEIIAAIWPVSAITVVSGILAVKIFSQAGRFKRAAPFTRVVSNKQAVSNKRAAPNKRVALWKQ